MTDKIPEALAVLDRHIETHRALAGSDAYSAQELPRLEKARAAFAELIESSKSMEEYFHPNSWAPKIVAIRKALAAVENLP